MRARSLAVGATYAKLPVTYILAPRSDSRWLGVDFLPVVLFVARWTKWRGIFPVVVGVFCGPLDKMEEHLSSSCWCCFRFPLKPSRGKWKNKKTDIPFSQWTFDSQPPSGAQDSPRALASSWPPGPRGPPARCSGDPVGRKRRGLGWGVGVGGYGRGVQEDPDLSKKAPGACEKLDFFGGSMEIPLYSNQNVKVQRSSQIAIWLWVKNMYPKWLALVNGNLDYNLRSDSWCFNFDPHPQSQGAHLRSPL